MESFPRIGVYVLLRHFLYFCLTCSSFLCRPKENILSPRTVFFFLPTLPQSEPETLFCRAAPSIKSTVQTVRMPPETSSALIKEVQKKLNKFNYRLSLVTMDLYGMRLLWLWSKRTYIKRSLFPIASWKLLIFLPGLGSNLLLDICTFCPWVGPEFCSCVRPTLPAFCHLLDFGEKKYSGSECT